MNPNSSNWSSVRSWPRSMRLTIATVAVIITVAIMAACGGALEYLVFNCQVGRLNWPVICSKNGLTTLQVVGLIALTVASVRWVLYLTRILAIREESFSPARNRRNDAKSLGGRIETAQLPLGQVLMSGIVESIEPGRRRAIIQGVDLRFWGGYALRSGWMTRGDRVAVVYQRFLGLNYVLVFWNGADGVMRAVGTWIHALFLILAILGMALPRPLKPGVPFWLTPVCVMLFVVSSAYLLFVTRARRALRDAISSVV